MLYPQKISAKKGNCIKNIMIIVSVIISIVLIIINRLTTPQIPWSGLSIAGIVYTWITTIYSINKNTNIAAHVLVQIIIISVLVVYIDYTFDFKKWSLNIAIPILIIIANVTMLVLTIVSHKKYMKYAIYQLIIFILSMIPIFFILEDIIEKGILNTIAISIATLSFFVCLILCGKDMKEEIIRKFHT